MRFLSILSILILSGCGTIGSFKTSCSQLHSSFIEQIDCVNNKIAKSPTHKNNDLAQFYSLKADKLKKQVSEGEISEEDAKISLQATYIELISINNKRYIEGEQLAIQQQEAERRQRESMFKLPSLSPSTTNTTCSEIMGTINCRSTHY